ncbi:MAG: iron ABC transporter permease [Planctomycetes bacterium]|nr:iron ABC transporter permease [Planctomycetota bacterium]
MTLRVVLIGLLACACAWSLAIGPLPWSEVDRTVLMLRATRLGAGLLAGAALAVAGVLMQGLFRNPLASPSVAGVTAGAGLGAQIALVAFTCAAPWASAAVPLAWWLPIGAFAGAAGALAALYALARRRADLTSVLLIGMVLSILFSAMAAYLLAIGQETYQLGRALVAFSLGALEGASPATVAMAVPLVVVGTIAAWGWGRPLDLVLSGEAEAASLGVDLVRARRWLLAWTALLAATSVTLGGGVGFVCLVVPNALRAWQGPAHRPLVVSAAIGGALFLTLADICARVCHPGPGEIPLGVITGLVGAPFFLWFFRRERRAGRM